MKHGWERNNDSWRILFIPLQQHHMKDIMNTSLRWKPQTISHSAQTLNNLIGSKEARPNLEEAAGVIPAAVR